MVDLSMDKELRHKVSSNLAMYTALLDKTKEAKLRSITSCLNKPVGGIDSEDGTSIKTNMLDCIRYGNYTLRTIFEFLQAAKEQTKNKGKNE